MKSVIYEKTFFNFRNFFVYFSRVNYDHRLIHSIVLKHVDDIYGYLLMIHSKT